VSLSRVQAVVGLVAGIVSIVGATGLMPKIFKASPGMGQVVAIVEDARTRKAVPDATIELLTPQNALVTTVTPNHYGKARQTLQEGPYRLRVTHPKFAAEVRQVQVMSEQTTEVHVQLRSGVSSPLGHAGRAIDEGVSAIRRVFGN
jgi:hypothetical protein